MALPKSDTERRIFVNYLKIVKRDKPLTFYVGSCPDYAHNGDYYTHQGIGGDVPLLTVKHLASVHNLFEQLEASKIPYEYVVMVADVEAMDQVFCDKFTHGDQDRFLDLCLSSVLATQEFIKQNFSGLEYGTLRSSSFFGEFDKDEFMRLEKVYTDLLHSNYQNNGSMRSRIDYDTNARMSMYRAMYDVVLPGMSNDERDEFLILRTERTMAQYLTLGRLIGQTGNLASIICHPTQNQGMFNARNKLLLPDDDPRYPQPTIPIFAMNRRVY